MAALPLLRRHFQGEGFEAAAANPQKAFAEVDADGGGLVLFDEFAHWVLSLGIKSLLGMNSEEGSADRDEALELLKKQKPNLASAEEAPTAVSRPGRTPARSGSREKLKCSSSTPTARQLSTNRAAAAKASAARPPSASGAGSRRPSKGPSPSPAGGGLRPSSSGARLPAPKAGASSGRRPSPAPKAPAAKARAGSRGPSPAPRVPAATSRAGSHGPSPAPAAVSSRGGRAGSRGLSPEPTSAAHLAAAGRHSGSKAQAILSGNYSAGYAR